MGSVGNADSASMMAISGIVPEKKPRVFVVLGGAGAGKSTQCKRIAEQMGYTHLSSGDLLRAEAQKETDEGIKMRTMLKEAVIFTSDIMNNIILKAMKESGSNKFLLDGFPRSEENRQAFEAFTQIEPELVLFFECSEEERLRRIMSRKQVRNDDNVESIKKRFKAFQETTIPVIQYYESRGKVARIDAEKPEEVVFQEMKKILMAEDGPDRNLLTNILMCRHNFCAIL